MLNYISNYINSLDCFCQSTAKGFWFDLAARCICVFWVCICLKSLSCFYRAVGTEGQRWRKRPEKEKSRKKQEKYGIGRIAWSQNSDVLHTDFVTPYFLLSFSWSSDQGLLSLIILQQATRKTYPRVYQCIWGNYIIFAKKNHNSTILSTWVVYTYMHVWKCDCV